MLRSVSTVILLTGPAFAPLAAQIAPATLVGVTFDVETRAPLPDVELALEGTPLRVRSSEDGAFRFDVVEPGLIVMRSERPGYASRTDTLAVAAGERVEVRVGLSVQAIELQPLDVVARRGTLGTGITGRYPGLTRTQIEAWIGRTSSLADLVRLAAIPGVRVTEVATSAQGPIVCAEHARARSGLSGGACRPMAVYLDGRLSVDAGAALANLPPEAIERFEVLSPLDAVGILGNAGARGAILVETRSGTGLDLNPSAVYPRDARRLVLGVAVGHTRASTLYDGIARFGFAGSVETLRYQENAAGRWGARASLRTSLPHGLPDLEAAGIFERGRSAARFAGTPGGVASQSNRMRTMGLDVVIRPRLVRRQRFDLFFLAGGTVAWEALTVGTPAGFDSVPGLGSAVERTLGRSWTSSGFVVGGEAEWALSPRLGATVGARWRRMSLGTRGVIDYQRLAEGAEQLELPSLEGRVTRVTLEVGMTARLGAPARLP